MLQIHFADKLSPAFFILFLRKTRIMLCTQRSKYLNLYSLISFALMFAVAFNSVLQKGVAKHLNISFNPSSHTLIFSSITIIFRQCRFIYGLFVFLCLSK